MGDLNQLDFVKNHRQIVKGPILEVGSKDYGNTQDLRSLFPDCNYVGVDIEEGRGVDIKLDLISDVDAIISKIGSHKFNTLFCLSVLEHCENPFKMSFNISSLINRNGIIFISVPFSWRIHGYPSDYWRFTPEGVRKFFPDFNFDIYPR